MNTQHLDSALNAPSAGTPKTAATLRSRVGVVLHTYQAQNLLQGRKAQPGKPGIMGLTAFSERLKALWHGARHDDPYADWYLLKIERGLRHCEHQYQTLIKALDQHLAQIEEFDITIADSGQPQTLSLRLANPYAFQGLRRLVEYDHVIRSEMTLKHLGTVLPESLQAKVDNSGRLLRRVLSVPQRYCLLNIDRAAVAQGTAQASVAQKRMGVIPADILSGQRLPAIRPLSQVEPSTDASSSNQEATSA
ncbi:TIGR03761 family integrating conjugative element protein [Pseudomaricurvus alkylphenolicus]|uniref:PFL_4669 family integrating conjugative element protein n=1 Tax=Pseudomaricurvus alkylphenolicus TaxID=1306991 RepID=UPI00141DE33A|nr:TIGR03761 family integrating conjugative element protein [Pseudomaricurvus alkylphenolicus]NIB44063.1 TIGR03761 family integrating conjugative element protein [Pseudomaricurvus alkylphenolicus]